MPKPRLKIQTKGPNSFVFLFLFLIIKPLIFNSSSSPSEVYPDIPLQRFLFWDSIVSLLFFKNFSQFLDMSWISESLNCGISLVKMGSSFWLVCIQVSHSQMFTSIYIGLIQKEIAHCYFGPVRVCKQSSTLTRIFASFFFLFFFLFSPSFQFFFFC